MAAARADEAASGAVYIHAYDDLKVMAGQGTMADEVVLSGHGPFDAAQLRAAAPHVGVFDDGIVRGGLWNSRQTI